MEQRNTENFIILILSIGCLGLAFESVLMGWEFWVPPLIIIGTIILWVINITQSPDYELRRMYYLAFGMFAVLYHGVHSTSFFDVAIVTALIMVTYSFMGILYVEHLLLAEYIVLMITQIIMATTNKSIVFDALNISRLILHVAVVILIYASCVRAIINLNESQKIGEIKDALIDSAEADMEDFLSNISHELRTPVNVVNGMSDLLIKKHVGSEAFTVKDAGIRLAYLIEDIQDYTECKREKVMLEEEDYESVSLINDVVSGFRLIGGDGLELVVDMDPSVPHKMHGDVKKIHKIFRMLLENGVKFTKRGGIYVRLVAENAEYGVNLCIEMTDTGIGMSRKALDSVSEGMYQVNKKRNRSAGGIGLGLFIVYGFAHRMGGFVKIESEKRVGTTVRVTIPQKVVDPTHCLMLKNAFKGNILFHVRSDKYKVPKVRDFYRNMASNLAVGMHVPLYPAETIRDIERLCEKYDVTHIFMGQEEYEENPGFFDQISMSEIVVAVSSYPGFKPSKGSRVMVMPKPLYAYPIIKILNDGRDAGILDYSDESRHLTFPGVKALVVDDEPMNLVVASSLFSDYEMIVDTAGSGKEAIDKFKKNEYDLVFMDHMMPEMDGVEAMHRINMAAAKMEKNVPIIALTANAVSGAKEMFIKEGFDGFIAKPMHTSDFEKVILQVLPNIKDEMGGDEA